MKTYITRINGWGLWDKSHYMQHMVAEIARQLDFWEMGIYRYNAETEKAENLSVRLDGIIAGINRGDFVICQFPMGNGLRFERELVSRLMAYGGRVAIFIHELEPLAQKEKQSWLEEIIDIYNKAEVLIVPTYAMRQWLLDNGVKVNMKFVVQKMWDYTAKEPHAEKLPFRKEIFFMDSEGFEGMNDWNYSVPLKAYNVSVQRGNVQNLGGKDSYQLFAELAQGGGFGLVWFRDEYYKRYMEQGNSFSLARYLAAGIPVIAPAGISHSALIEANHLGLIVSSLEEAVAAVEKMTEDEYREYVRSVEEFAPALRNGYFTKKCLIEAMQAFYRKDAGRISFRDRIYQNENNEFRSVEVHESYEGDLIFSWEYQGETDGFLIFDTDGTLLGDMWEMNRNYYWLQMQKKENGFIIKAYVETLRGKLILAESEPVYIQERRHRKPKVRTIQVFQS